MFIIQNALLLPLSFSQSDKTANLFKDVLRNKYINRIMLYSGDEDFNMRFPNSNNFFPQLGEIERTSFFLSLVDAQGKTFINDFDLRNSVADIYTPDYNHNLFIEYLINRKLDLTHSTITVKAPYDSNLILPVIFFYQSKSLTKNFTDEVNGSVSIQITPTSEREIIPLSKYITNALAGQLVKKIYCSGHSAYHYPNGFLDLTCKDGKRIENLPIDILRAKSPKDFYFDMLDIDFEKSYFKHDSPYFNTTPLTLTFIY